MLEKKKQQNLQHESKSITPPESLLVLLASVGFLHPLFLDWTHTECARRVKQAWEGTDEIFEKSGEKQHRKQHEFRHDLVRFISSRLA